MIEGLHVTVPGTEVARLLREKAAQHTKRAEDYRRTYETLKTAMGDVSAEDAPKMSSLHSDPVKNAKESMERHENNAREDEFIAAHVDVNESFLLDTGDLARLGVLRSRY